MIFESLFHDKADTRQEKIKYLFDRELENNTSRLYVHNHNFEATDGEYRMEKFWYPRILLEKFTELKFVKYDIYNTGSEIYAPLSDEHIDLCIKYGIDAYSRTLRIYSRKKLLKKLIKSRNLPENWEEIKENLENMIEKIYSGGNTINLNLIK